MITERDFFLKRNEDVGGINGEIIRNLIVEVIEYRFGIAGQVPWPIHWLIDNGPAYISHETQAFARSMGLEICTTPHYTPESNGIAKAFIKTFKRDYFRMHVLTDAITAMEQLLRWFEDYNENYPYKGLKMMSPREYIKLMNSDEECSVQ